MNERHFDASEGRYRDVIVHRKADGFMAIHPRTGESRFLTLWECVKFRLRRWGMFNNADEFFS